MKALTSITFTAITLAFFSTTFTSCSKDESIDPVIQATLSQAEKDMLLFMLEEEKLARDTYIAMDAAWGIIQFTNIQNSEQNHMDKIAALLDQYNVAYSILPEGQFSIQSLQDMYDQFMVDGAVSAANALQIGATIEDLDIVDLQENMDATSNTDIDATFEKLQCSSRNHLRAFDGAITGNGDTYTPQYLTQAEYDVIVAGGHESCH